MDRVNAILDVVRVGVSHTGLSYGSCKSSSSTA